jgi:hypothetical protein
LPDGVAREVVWRAGFGGGGLLFVGVGPVLFVADLDQLGVLELRHGLLEALHPPLLRVDQRRDQQPLVALEKGNNE